MTHGPSSDINFNFDSDAHIMESEYNGTPDKILSDAIEFYDKRLDQLGEEINVATRKLDLKKKEWFTVRELLEKFHKAKQTLKDSEN